MEQANNGSRMNRKALLRQRLVDGAWHRYEDLVADFGCLVRPEIAVRRWHRCRGAADSGRLG